MADTTVWFWSSWAISAYRLSFALAVSCSRRDDADDRPQTCSSERALHRHRRRSLDACVVIRVGVDMNGLPMSTTVREPNASCAHKGPATTSTADTRQHGCSAALRRHSVGRLWPPSQIRMMTRGGIGGRRVVLR